MSDHPTTIPFDSMKTQVEESLVKSLGDEPLPFISYEKGETRISAALKSFQGEDIFIYLSILGKYIDNMRIVSFENGHYGFQALNKSIYNSDNLTDNIKFDIFNLVTTRIEISKRGDLSQEEIGAVVAFFSHALGSGNDPQGRLRALGATVFHDAGDMGWDYIAGYEEVKRTIRESIILPLKQPEIYDTVARLTRTVYESNRPKAILFDGPPGVGKTTIARIIAGEVEIPLVYVPVESIMSKWYGQSSQNLSQIFDACEDLGGAIIFLDEIDSLAGSRDGGLFEATRRVLSVLLRKLDGMDSVEKTITIGATNRTVDLDSALVSRFDQTIYFALPDRSERTSIFSRYARHLTAEEAGQLAERSEGMSGRTIKDSCEIAERRWTRRLIIKKMDLAPPPVDYYKHAIKQKLASPVKDDE